MPLMSNDGYWGFTIIENKKSFIILITAFDFSIRQYKVINVFIISKHLAPKKNVHLYKC